MIPPLPRRAIVRTALALFATAAAAQAQVPDASWRDEAAAVGTTARVLIIGAHPDDEDNALIAWLSLGRHIETAYLSLTRGENGVNLMGRERGALLGMVRTAELLAERKRDGAHQYFTRAYDFGFAKNDSVAFAAWPRDSVLIDVVSVVRAFRPHVVISLFAGDSTDHNGQHQVAGELAREAFMLAGDTVRYPPSRTSRLGAWNVGALYQLVDSGDTARALQIDVGELDRERGRTYAELGAEVRRLQRTQPALRAPPFGAVYRYLRRDSVRAVAADAERNASAVSSLFAAADTGWTRFATLPVADSVRVAVDSIAATTSAIALRARGGTPDSVSADLGRIVRLAIRARDALRCAEPAAFNCPGLLGDLAVSLAATRDGASRALLDANGIVVDVTAERDAVAAGDSVAVTASVYNGGHEPIDLTRAAFIGAMSNGFSRSDIGTIAPDSVGRASGFLRVGRVTYPWWMPPGLVFGTWIYGVPLNQRFPVNTQLLTGEDRVLSTAAFVAVHVGETDVTARLGPIVARAETALRGDDRRPIAGVPRLSVLLERGKEYARAGVPFERLYRVWVGSSVGEVDTVSVVMNVPGGLSADSAARTVVLRPFGSRTLFYRVRGRWTAGERPIDVSVTERAVGAPVDPRAGTRIVGSPSARINTDVVTVNTGMVAFEYPHIPTQRYARMATDSVQAIALHVPSRLRVAIVRTARDDEIESRIVELGIDAYTVDPSALGVTDLSYYTTILIAPRAYAEIDALGANAAVVRRFAERGGTVVVLYGRTELLTPGVLPYSLAFGAPDAITALDPQAPIRFTTPRSPLLDWPNRISPADFADWVTTRALELPAAFDTHYRTAIEMNDDNGRPTDSAILSARIGTGVFIYTAVSLDEQLAAANPGAARLLVNLLSAAAKRP